MKIGYLGPEASFTHHAVKSVFTNEEYIAFPTIPDCLEALAEGKVDRAVVPLENALEGSVPITIDYLFHDVDLHITAELISPIEQHLMVHPDNVDKWQEVTKIMSHSHALAQCHKYLYYRFRGIDLEPSTSTSAAAKYVSEHKEENVAAIGNSLAADTYGLKIVEENIHDFHFNHTRFVVLTSEKESELLSFEQDAEKSTLMVTLPSDDRPGALHQVLSAFSWRQLSLSKIESRPLKTGLGNYFFIIDVEKPVDGVLMQGAIEELEALGCTVKVLGSYRKHLLEPQK
ncbi:prephenate dehydratase [Jeotgalibacillus malaysiensis]|uniref:Prephenate dehydratase n=1 Tax=Jeotgalibacillus malaysiensis TaxID=1508404 RepID=A0A0B5ASU4_9BACL|nr:prephenate dehydratase [Jeotgalibacillus malaysiensis]AJD91643.1 prephenate dehydratase [Jeotgalibacillus malaysiensis]